jgi:hypothetical protein
VGERVGGTSLSRDMEALVDLKLFNAATRRRHRQLVAGRKRQASVRILCALAVLCTSA